MHSADRNGNYCKLPKSVIKVMTETVRKSQCACVACRAKKEEISCLPYVGMKAGGGPTGRWTGCLDADKLLGGKRKT